MLEIQTILQHFYKLLMWLWWTFLWLKWVGLPPAVLSPSILSKGVETGPTATQFSPTCAQTMSRLPGARLRQAERDAYPLFLPQK